MKVKRFVKEYASYKRHKIEKEMDDRNRFKEVYLYEIDNVVRNLERGLITIDEAMRIISEI